MASSDDKQRPRLPVGALGSTQPAADAASEKQLLADGWQRCFVADEPRLSEAIEAYEEMGLEVALLPVSFDDDETCTECLRQDPDRYRVIFTRRRRR